MFKNTFVLLETQEELLHSSADIISLPNHADDQIGGKYEFNGDLYFCPGWIALQQCGLQVSVFDWSTGKKDTHH